MALKYSIKFVLLKPGLKYKSTTLRCFIRYNYNQVVINTGIKIEPRYFSVEKQRADETSKFNGSDINNRLDEIRAFINSRFKQFNEFPDTVRFKEICDSFIKRGDEFKIDCSEKNHTGIVSYLEHIIEETKLGARVIVRGPRKGLKYSDGTIKTYCSVLEILKKLAAYNLVLDFPFKSIDQSFYKNLWLYYNAELKLSVAYFGTVVKIIKLVMNESKQEGIHSYDYYNSRGFVKPEYESDKIYLNISQLEQLQSFRFPPEKKYLDNARDLFLIGCWTGLRFSDFSALETDDISDSIIRIKVVKTSERIAIPLHPMLKKIIEKYGGDLPNAVSNQKLNAYIKEAARLAGLTEEVYIKVNKAGVISEEKREFCELISSHTARRSFATNMFKKGIPTLLIMAITGHKTEAAFLKYIRVSNEEKALMMAELWKKIDWT